MNRLRTMLIGRDVGASAVEYGLVVVAIAAAVVAIVFVLGSVVEDTYSESCTTIQTAAQTSTTC